MSRMFHAPGVGCLQDSIALQTVSASLGNRPMSRAGRQMGSRSRACRVPVGPWARRLDQQRLGTRRSTSASSGSASAARGSNVLMPHLPQHDEEGHDLEVIDVREFAHNHVGASRSP